VGDEVLPPIEISCFCSRKRIAFLGRKEKFSLYLAVYVFFSIVVRMGNTGFYVKIVTLIGEHLE
jgi:hypothetical protein